MRKLLSVLLILTTFCSSLCLAAQSAYLLNITDPIGPATYDYVNRGLTTAQEQHAALVIVTLNTPGGFDKPTHQMIQKMMTSSTPIVTYVLPNGAVSDQGLFILYAGGIAAMAPNSLLGSADLLTNKDFAKLNVFEKNSLNKDIVYIRHLAELQHRNTASAEFLVRHNLTLSAEQALKANVINIIANDIPQLLQKLNNTTVNTNHIPIVLNTKDMQVKTIPFDWRYNALFFITNPVVTYLLLLIGILGILFAFLSTRRTSTGFIGIICLITAFYAFQLLGIHFLGLTLVLAGITCMVAEMIMTRFGVAGVCGILSFTIGSMLLLNMHSPGYGLVASINLILSFASASLFYLILSFVIKAQKPKRNNLIGKIGEVLECYPDYVMVRIHNQIRNAQSKSNRPLKIGQKVRIITISNAILTVEPITKILKK